MGLITLLINSNIKNGNHRGARAIDLFRFRNKIACLIDINHFLKTNSVMALE